MFPLEVLTLGASTALSFGMKFVSIWMQNKAEERKLLLGLRETDLEHQRFLVKQSGGFAITRRIIALSCIATLIVWPSIAGLFGIPIHFTMESNKSVSVLWGLFSDQYTEPYVLTKMGFVYFKWHVHVILSIIGLYFGQTLADKR
jgi:hypothetical protein